MKETWVCVIRIKTNEGFRSHLIEKSSFTIGRTQDADLPILAPSVSRLHLSVELKRDNVWIVDQKSANGTFVNEQAIDAGEMIALRPEDVVRLGTSEIDFQFLSIPRPFELQDGSEKKESLAISMEDVAKEIEAKTRDQAEKEVREAKMAAEQLLSNAKKELEIMRTQASVEIQERRQQVEAEFLQMRQTLQSEGTQERLRARREGDIMIAEAQKRIQKDYEGAGERVNDQLKEAQSRADEMVNEAELKAQAMLIEAREEATELRARSSEEAREIHAEAVRKSTENMKERQERSLREASEKREELLAAARAENDRERDRIYREFQVFKEREMRDHSDNIERSTRELDERVTRVSRELEERTASVQDEIATRQAKADKEFAELSSRYETQHAERVEAQRKEAADQHAAFEDEAQISRKKAESELNAIFEKFDNLQNQTQKLTEDRDSLTSEISASKKEVTSAKELLARVEDLETRRAKAESALNTFVHDREQGLSTIETEFKELRDKNTVEYEARKRDQEIELSKSRLRALEDLQKRISSEEGRYEQTMRLRSIEVSQRLTEILVPMIQSSTEDVDMTRARFKEAIDSTVLNVFLQGQSAIQIVATDFKEKPKEEVEKRSRRINRSMVAATAAVLGLVGYFGKDLYQLAGQHNQKDNYATQMIDARKAASVFTPDQTDEFRDSYADNVLYMTGYYDKKMNLAIREKWTLKLNDLTFLQPMGLSEEDIVQYISKETNLIIRLGTLRDSIDAVYLSQGLQRVHDAEAEDIVAMKAALKGEANYEKIREIEKSFLSQN